MQQRKPLSVRQRRIMEFIKEFMQDNWLPPTVRDIQRACDVSSTSVVDYNLRLLEREGYIRRKPDIARGIELVDEPDLVQRGRPVPNRVPVMAYIAAGEPLPLVDADGWVPGEPLDTIEVPPEMLARHQRLYALRVKGTSMIDALVDDGDVVLVEPGRQASDGEMVVARLRLENETTLKHLYREGDKVRLQPANRLMEPIYSAAENVEVQGRVVGVLRMMQ